MNLDKKLVYLRKKKGLTQLQLAELMDVSRQAISRWEVGAAVPSTENLSFLSNLYHVPLEYLISDSEPDVMLETEPTVSNNTVNVERKNVARVPKLVGFLSLLVVVLSVLVGVLVYHITSLEKLNDNVIYMDDMIGGDIETSKEKSFGLGW